MCSMGLHRKAPGQHGLPVQIIIVIITQGSKKPPSGRPGQVDFPFGQVTFSPYLPDGQEPCRHAVRRLNFDNDFEKKR